MRKQHGTRLAVLPWLIAAVVAGSLAFAPAALAAPAPRARAVRAQTVVVPPQERLAPSGHAATAPARFTSDDDYKVPPPPKSIGRTILKSVGETLQTVGNTVATVGVTGLLANGLASAGLVTLPATVPGAAASAIIAGSGIAISVVGGFIKNYFSDPPDFNYAKIAQPAQISVTEITSKNPLLEPIDAANYKLLSTVMEGYAVSKAFQTSVNRADGAIIRHNVFWRDRQIAAALRYASRGARLIGRLPGLQQAVFNAFQSSKIAAILSPENVAKNRRGLTSSAAQKALRAQLAKLGLSRYFQLVFGLIAGAQPGSYGIEFPQIVLDPTLIKLEKRAANELTHYTSSTILQIIKAGH